MNIACIKVGSRYKPEYVNRLYSMLCRHAGFDFKFYCFTEKPDGIRPEVNVRPLYYAFDPPWWDKLWLFKPVEELADDYLLTLDLDIVITGSLAFLSGYRGDFLGLRAWEEVNRWNGSFWLLKPGAHADIWERFVENAYDIMHRLYSDQEWLDEAIPHADDIETLFPGKILGFRRHYQNILHPEQSYFDEKAAMYIFHGIPKPHEVTHIPWVKQNWR